MRYAASIRYGGQLVEADVCDYDDYKHLGLICPNCSEAVFLQKLSNRNLVEKAIVIPAHFKHFATKDPVLVKQCEARVAKYDQREIERRAAVSRNQRLKTLQRFFWSIFSQHPKFGDMSEVSENLSINIFVPQLKERVLPTFANKIRLTSKELKNQMDEFMVSIFDKKVIDNTTLDALLIGISDPKAIFDSSQCVTSLDKKMHRLICHEVLDFLLSRNAQNLLNEVMLFEMSRFILGMKKLASVNPPDKIEPDDEFLGRVLVAMLSGMLATIITTPWSSEFTRLQNDKNHSQPRTAS